MKFKLGKLAPVENSKTLSFAKYLKANAPPPPPTKTYWEYRVSAWPMFANDSLGDCVFAGGGHMLENWTAHSGTQVDLTDDEIIAAYSAVTGYVPGDPSTDNGAAITDFLQYWKDSGFAGNNIDGWAQISNSDVNAIKQGIYLFGGVDVGVQLPKSAMDQFSAGQSWEVLDDDGGLDGGHCIPILGYGANGCTCVTWGKLQQMSWDWFLKYCDEAYGLVTLSWLAQNGEAPNHLDIATLRQDLQALKS